jgi:uncharacterized protein
MGQISSPCVKVCVLDAARGLCLGCGRTLAEIGGWLRMADHERAAVKRQLDERLKALRAEAP